jgi:hypothetical protein
MVAVAALLVAAAPAAALSPSSSIGGSINPSKGPVGTPLKLTVRFNLNPGPGEPPGTLNRAILQLPPNGVTNGKFFPSCSADTINRAHGSFRNCPKGSQIGAGKLYGDVFNLDLVRVPGRVTLFNGPGGKSITVHVYLTNPALIRIALDAPLVKTPGRYGYRLTAPVPEGLQELIPDAFAGLRTFTSTVWATKKVHGKTRGYIEAKTCPKSGRVPIAGQFFFREGGTTSSVGSIKCTPTKR